jgi:uncharacterized membrane protein
MVPFVTAWMGEHHFEPVPTALYGIVLICAAAAYTILQRALIKEQGPGSRLASAIGPDRKGLASLGIYLIALPIAFYRPWISDLLYALVALTWLVPDSRIEHRIREG